MRIYKFVIALAAWLGTGLVVVQFAGLSADSLSWWLLFGLPGLLVGGGLIFGFGVVVVGLYLGLAMSGPRR